MKIFIYHDYIDNPIIKEHNAKLADANRLHQHLEYLDDFYNLFKQYETSNPLEADYFFIPIFLTGWQFANHDPGDWINLCTFLAKGNHILLATGDFGQRCESIHETKVPNRGYNKKYGWLDSRFILLALESTAYLHEQDIAFLPYSTKQIAPPAISRDIYLSFAGVLSHSPALEKNHIRGGKLLEFKNSNQNLNIIIGSLNEFKQKFDVDITYHNLMARSFFTLCPAGYGRWTFRFIEALLNGSIPILISDDYLIPFSDVINWDDYCIVIPEDKLSDIDDILNKYKFSEIYNKLNNIKRDRYKFEKEFNFHQIASRLESKKSPNSVNYADRAIGRMRSPYEMGIICVDVTNKCDLSCSNCTRLLKNQDEYWEMSPENFRNALQTLHGYPGLMAMIGGNPCMHTKFEELCRIFEEEVPSRSQRGLWTNNIFNHKDIIESTFGAFNLNPHGNQKAIGSVRALYDNMVINKRFAGGYYEGHSEHAPILTALKDIYNDEEKIWDQISTCDINRDWSATIIQNKGNLRIYFCEVAASFDLARNEDHGYKPFPGWWKSSIKSFSHQVKIFCPGCGVPARLKANFDHEEVDTYTTSNQDIAVKSNLMKKRKIIYLNVESAETLSHKFTKYADNAR
jgi:organic radical activating enzyme